MTTGEPVNTGRMSMFRLFTGVLARHTGHWFGETLLFRFFAEVLDRPELKNRVAGRPSIHENAEELRRLLDNGVCCYFLMPDHGPGEQRYRVDPGIARAFLEAEVVRKIASSDRDLLDALARELHDRSLQGTA